MAEMIKDFWLGMPIGLYIILFLAFGLLVASFACPPVGIINSTVFQGAALILGAAWLFYTTSHIPEFIEKGAKIKASVGNATLEIGRKKNRLDEEEGPE